MTSWKPQALHEAGKTVVNVNALTWSVLFTQYLAPWTYRVCVFEDDRGRALEGVELDAEQATRESLLSPYHGTKALSWDNLKAGPAAVQAMHSAGLKLHRHADNDTGGRSFPSHESIALAMGYGKGGTKYAKTHLERLERLGWVECYSRVKVKRGPGYHNVYGLTVPVAITTSLEEWGSGDPSESQHIAAIHAAINNPGSWTTPAPHLP